MNDFQILIGGAAGKGSKAAGRLIAKVLNEYGYKIFVHEDYPSLIRGGHNFSLIRASKEEKKSIKEKIDFLLALDEETVKKHIDKLDGDLIYNSDEIEAEGIGVPIKKIAEEEGSKIMENTAIFGAFCKIIGIKKDILKKITDTLPKPEENFKVAEKAYQTVENKITLEKEGDPSSLVTGNEAIALGALESGMDNYFAYPMTPSTGILHYLAKEKSIQVVQPENEIAVINMALGASYAGKRTMVGTSGGGFALMSETLSLAAISETPIVIVNAQRPGPASGVPTYNGQSDLNLVLGSGHGDFLKFVFAPGDAEESYYLTNLAMNLSWKYQIPSIILTDKDVGESTFSFNKSALEKFKEKRGENNENYERYKDTENGVSPLCFPGGEAVVRASSYEHNEYGTTTEKPEEIVKMQDKRMKKEKYIKREVEGMIKVFGEGKKTLVTWGSSKGATIEAGKELGYKVIQILSFSPFPEEKFKEAIKDSEEISVVEANRGGQCAEFLKKYTKIDKKILKYDGRPFLKQEIIKNV